MTTGRAPARTSVQVYVEKARIAYPGLPESEAVTRYLNEALVQDTTFAMEVPVLVAGMPWS
jgi:hypothetical protein